ncbi:DNA polymerase III subunit delta' [Marinobacter sp.]|uniref:DNA polymerase III subunit delta' n=1 Tax=Marinobacter sp. TaxID=50741 RepID=UPI0034A1DF10
MPWLDEAWNSLQQRIGEGRLPHALLINGERGVGKRAFAESVAALLMCDHPGGNNGEPLARCGHCKQCQLVEAGTHPDIRLYSPEKSRMIKVDQIRALSTFAVSSPQVGRRKVAIIDRADQLNINSANALLKTLEEPSSDTVLILLQESGRPVLPTIRSRCQSMVIAVPQEEVAARWLSLEILQLDEKDRPTAEQAAKALAMAANAPRLALDYLNGDFLALRDQALEGFRQFMKGKLTVGEAAKPFKALGLEAALWLFERWAADLARIAAGGQPRDADAADMLGYLASSNPPWRAHQLLEQIHEARSATVYNVNPELEATRLLMAWQTLMPRRKRASA